MMAKKLQIGMMGDYPLLVNGATGQSQAGNETQLVAVITYNAFGSGNGVAMVDEEWFAAAAMAFAAMAATPAAQAEEAMVIRLGAQRRSSARRRAPGHRRT